LRKKDSNEKFHKLNVNYAYFGKRYNSKEEVGLEMNGIRLLNLTLLGKVK